MKAPWSSEDIKAGLSHATGMTGSKQPSCLREGTGPGSRYAKAWALYFSKFISACKFNYSICIVSFGSAIPAILSIFVLSFFRLERFELWSPFKSCHGTEMNQNSQLHGKLVVTHPRRKLILLGII
jgi:hypothetical protein